MSRHSIQERVYASPRLRRWYARAGLRRARAAWRAGDLHAALARGLRAWKHAGPVWTTAQEALVRGWIDEALRPEGAWRPVAANPLAAAWRRHPDMAQVRARFDTYPVGERARLRSPKPDSPWSRPGDLVVLKRHDPASKEPGVLLVTYNHGIERLSGLYDLGALAGKYILVLEPSTWGYQDARFLPYVGNDLDVVVMAQSAPDFDFVASLASNLVPTTLGAGDWVDPDRFGSKPHGDRTYDIAMVGSWDPLKRHALFFRTLAALKRRGRKLRCVAVGYPQAWEQADVERLARRHGVDDLLTFFNFIPYDDVAALLADSRCSVLLSRREGANRAIYESWMADTPTVVYRHHRGVNLRQIAPANGVLADDDELADALEQVLTDPTKFSPRAWALEHTGCHVAMKRLQEVCQGLCERRGLPWTQDCVARAYSGYRTREEHDAMAPEYEVLASYLLP